MSAAAALLHGAPLLGSRAVDTGSGARGGGGSGALGVLGPASTSPTLQLPLPGEQISERGPSNDVAENVTYSKVSGKETAPCCLKKPPVLNGDERCGVLFRSPDVPGF